MRSLTNIFWLGIKELRSLLSDFVLVAFVLYAFTWTIYSQATGTSNEVNNASIAFADEDGSALSEELFNAFYPPRFQRPQHISAKEVEDSMDRGRFMFVVTMTSNCSGLIASWCAQLSIRMCFASICG